MRISVALGPGRSLGAYPWQTLHDDISENPLLKQGVFFFQARSIALEGSADVYVPFFTRSRPEASASADTSA